MKIISVDTMRSLDARTIAGGVCGFQLMERAGSAAFQEMMAFLERRVAERHRRRFAVVAGKGNNGGDAYVVARCIAESTSRGVTVYSVCPVESLTGDARVHARRLSGGVSVSVVDSFPEGALCRGTIVVDGLLGTGISGPLRAPYDVLISQINESGLPVISLDIPSGLNGDDGSVSTDAVVADMTVTMALPKSGLFRDRGRSCCGRLRCVDIGIPSAFVHDAESLGEAVFAQDVMPLLGRRPHDSHKGVFGHVLVVGGSRHYGGAPILAGQGALRVGSGLVTVAVPERASTGFSAPASLIVRRVSCGGTGFLGDMSRGEVVELAASMDAIVFGPGVGAACEGAGLLHDLLSARVPLVIDADGLRIVASHPELLPSRTAPVVLTPHPGEMRGLLNGFGLTELSEVCRPEQAVGLARRTDAVVVLKGVGTVIAAPDGRWAVNTSGSCALATAGTGDVLSGILAGLLGGGHSLWDAAAAGVFIHGYSADVSPVHGRSMTADDLAGSLPAAFAELTPFE